MIVLDSSFLCAWHNRRDVHHMTAVATMNRFLAGEWGRGLLLEYVFLEVTTVLLARRGRSAAFDAAHYLLEARELDWVASSDRFPSTLMTFRSQDGRGLSFTDAAIVAVAREHDPGYVATFDRGLADVDGVKGIGSV